MKNNGFGKVFFVALMVGWWSGLSTAQGEIPEEWQEIMNEYTGSHPFGLWPEEFAQNYQAYQREIGETRFSRYQSLEKEIESALQRQRWDDAFLERERGETMTRWFTRGRLAQARQFRDRLLALEAYPQGYTLIQEGATLSTLSEQEHNARVSGLRNIGRYFEQAARVETVQGNNAPEAFRFIEALLFIGEELYFPMNIIEAYTAKAVLEMGFRTFWEMGWGLWPIEKREIWDRILATIHDREGTFDRLIPLEAGFVLDEFKVFYKGQALYD